MAGLRDDPRVRRTGVRIPSRYCGPPESANGGVTAGLLGTTIDATVVEVTLRRPPPLETELRLADGNVYDGTVLVAQARPSTLELEVPPAVDVPTARAAGASYAGLVGHPFPTCFVCGTERTDGLGLRPGPIGAGRVAAVWTPVEDDPVMVWAALDCPGGWAADVPGRPLVLGRTTLSLDRLPVAGEPHVVQGWVLGSEGRKVHTGTSLHDARGRVLARAQAVWFVVDLTPSS